MNYTTPEEYRVIRQKHIVEGIYGGDDNLAMEEKERRLLAFEEPGTVINYHSTTLDENGKSIGDGHVRMHQRVAILENTFLDERGLIYQPYC